MQLPRVSSEGGPIILGDFEALRAWRGVSDPSAQYHTACQLVARVNPSPIVLPGGGSVVWDFGGPGAADIVVVDPGHISLLRLWPDAAMTEAEAQSAAVSSATARFGDSVMGRLTISSGYLLVLWTPQDASEFSPPQGDRGVPDPGLTIADGGAYVRAQCGCYRVSVCEWQTEDYDVTKLDLRLAGPTRLLKRGR